MADQTEQEPIDPWKVVARWHRDGDGCDDLGCAEDHWSYWSDIEVARAADAAQVRERDAQIARLSAQVETAHAEGYVRAKEEAAAENGRLNTLRFQAETERDTLRAERDAAQHEAIRITLAWEDSRQQIATLTEMVAGKDKWIRWLWDHSFPRETLEDVLALHPELGAEFRAALSTRPQEALRELVDDAQKLGIYEATHQQGGHQP